MKTLHVVVGPTASGKTAFAIKLAQSLNTEIVSADSRQFFKELPIGSAAPNNDELNTVKHHLVGHLSVSENYTAAQFAQDADTIIQSIFSSHNDVVVCGGSGLYIDALVFGFDDIPSVNPVIRDKCNVIFEKGGLTALHEILKEVDPEFLNNEQLARNPRRCIRALEVYYETGAKMSEMKRRVKTPRYNIHCYYPSLSREEIYQRINVRTHQMIKDGLLEECEKVKMYSHVQALQTVGYKEVFSVWENKLQADKLIEAIQQNTRRYAKRQDTWFRNQLLSEVNTSNITYF